MELGLGVWCDNHRRMGNRPDFRERRKRCGDEIGFFLAVLGETDEFQAVPPTALADRPGLNNRRLHTMRRHDGIGQRQEAATAPETLGRAFQPEPIFSQYGADDAGSKADEYEASKRHQRQYDLSRPADPVQIFNGDPALFGYTDPVPEIPDFKRQQKIKLLRQTAENRENNERKGIESENAKNAIAIHRKNGGRISVRDKRFRVAHARLSTLVGLYQFAQAVGFFDAHKAQLRIIPVTTACFEFDFPQREEARQRLLFNADILNALERNGAGVSADNSAFDVISCSRYRNRIQDNQRKKKAEQQDRADGGDGNQRDCRFLVPKKAAKIGKIR